MTRNPWVGFLSRRLLSLAAVLCGLIVSTFLLVRLVPGDAALNIAGTEATQQTLDIIRSQLGLDRPPLEQFVTYVVHLSRGDLGQSFTTNEPVTAVLLERLPPSTELAACSLLLVLTFSVPLGMTAAALTYQGRRRRFEVIFMAATGALGALPTFLAATLLAGVFAVWLRWLPVAGSGTWQQLVLPVLAISLAPTLLLARIIRLETLNVLAQDYIRTARSKRLPSLHLYAFHVLPNVLTAALTVAGLLFANLVGGTVLAENVFARVGLGTSLVQAVIAKDYPVVQGIVLVLGCTVVLVNLVVDVVLGLIDPRTLTRKA